MTATAERIKGRKASTLVIAVMALNQLNQITYVPRASISSQLGLANTDELLPLHWHPG